MMSFAKHGLLILAEIRLNVQLCLRKREIRRIYHVVNNDNGTSVKGIREALCKVTRVMIFPIKRYIKTSHPSTASTILRLRSR